MTNLSRFERETIILFNEAGATAEIEAHNAAMKRRLATLRRRYPEEITIVRRDGYADTYRFPKAWIKIIPPRGITERQRAQLARARTKRYS
jgi:hypothetical protein